MRLKLRRVSLKVGQEALAGYLGVSFQQVQKYEKGANRMAPEMLYLAAQYLDVPVSYFFEGYGASEDYTLSNDRSDRVTQSETEHLLKAYSRIPHRADRDVAQSIVLGLSTFKVWQRGKRGESPV